MKVFISGGAGLVGLNLIASILKNNPGWKLIIVDKKNKSINIAKELFPSVEFLCEDIMNNTASTWVSKLKECTACIIMHAEIGNKDISQFERNNIKSTEILMDEIIKSKVDRLIHISSSVVNSTSNDEYTNSKRIQEAIVLEKWPKDRSGLVIFRPTLMFGWFDRKHLGWITRFMSKSPLFPIPGFGKFIRQPLYVGDFCRLIERALEQHKINGTFNISGMEKISYIKLMRTIKKSIRSKSIMIYLPIPLFGFLLQLWSIISKQPAFTQSQLSALTAGDQFEVIDWPSIFSVEYTPLKTAISKTNQDPLYSKIFIPF